MAQASLALACVFWFLCGQPGHQPAASNECVRLDRATKGLERIVSRDWRHVDRRLLEAEWPGVPVLALGAGNEGGLQVVAERLARSCETCDLSGGVAMDDKRAGLRAVDLWVCPRPLAALRSTLDALRGSVVGPTARPTSIATSEARAIEGYSWVSNHELFTLRADAIAIDDAWIGNVQLGRCRLEDVKDTWQVAPDRTVHVLRTDVEGHNRVLWFAYATTCLIEDRACRASELDGMWPILRSLAERKHVTEISIAAEDCVGRSVEFQIARSREGSWSGGLWSPERD